MLYFFGQDVNDTRRQENLVEYIDNLNFAVESQAYTKED